MKTENIISEYRLISTGLKTLTVRVTWLEGDPRPPDSFVVNHGCGKYSGLFVPFTVTTLDVISKCDAELDITQDNNLMYVVCEYRAGYLWNTDSYEPGYGIRVFADGRFHVLSHIDVALREAGLAVEEYVAGNTFFLYLSETSCIM